MSSCEPIAIIARFQLRLRCDNCRHLTVRDLNVPDVDEAPRDAGALLESALLARQRYTCDRCDDPIALVVGVREVSPDEAHGLTLDQLPS